MPKKKNESRIEEKRHQSEESDNDGPLGNSGTPMNYIYLKTRKNYKLKPDEETNKTLQLFRNEETNNYIKELMAENAHPTSAQAKRSKQRTQRKKQELLKDIFLHLQLSKNICVYAGFDKLDILDCVVTHLKDHQQFVFIVKGYIQPLNDKKVYNAFGDFLIKLGLTKTIDSVIMKDQREEYRELLENTPSNCRFYVVFYDLSNFGFLDSDIQRRLGELFSLPRVHLIASVESIKIARTWPLSNFTLYTFVATQELFKFVYFSALGIHEPTSKLLAHQPLPNEKAQKTENQIIQIWQSLNENQKAIGRILAKNELNNIQQGEENYLSFFELLDSCIEEVILSDDHQLRENLIELIDHRVVLENIDKTKNKKTYIMKLDRNILQRIINNEYDKMGLAQNQKQFALRGA